MNGSDRAAQPGTAGITVRFSTVAGEFVTVITDEESIERLDGAQPGDHVGIPNGIIRAGDGGVNVGHDWHLVEEHGDRFCPWNATILEILG